jgi:hypothetical protein
MSTNGSEKNYFLQLVTHGAHISNMKFAIIGRLNHIPAGIFMEGFLGVRETVIIFKIIA